LILVFLIETQKNDVTSYLKPSAPSSEHLPNFENSNLQLFKVIPGHQSWCQSKAHMYFTISHY